MARRAFPEPLTQCSIHFAGGNGAFTGKPDLAASPGRREHHLPLLSRKWGDFPGEVDETINRRPRFGTD